MMLSNKPIGQFQISLSDLLSHNGVSIIYLHVCASPILKYPWLHLLPQAKLEKSRQSFTGW